MEPPSSLISTAFYLLLSFILVALNAFFVASEFAIVKIRRTRLEGMANRGVKAAKTALPCVDNLDEYLSATQLGITIVSLALGWIGEESFFELFMLFVPSMVRESSALFHVIAGALSFTMITLLHVVLGELVPKSMAIQKPEKITLMIAGPLQAFYKFARPLIHAFTTIANWVLRWIGFHGIVDAPWSEEELRLVMRESREEGVISDSEAKIINRAFEFSDKTARDIMLPMGKVEYISLARGYEANMAITRNKMHTRFPLVRDGFESVLGIIHMKDVLYLFSEIKSNQAFEKAMRPAVFVAPHLREDQLMRMMNEKRAHMVIVQDSITKDNLGMVTMEDILEELVGEILDEHGH